MALFYPRKQTFVIAIICALAVAGTAIYVRSQTPLQNVKNQSAQNTISANTAGTVNSQDAVTTSIGTTANISGDWQKEFLADSTSSGVKLGKSSSSQASTEPQTFTDQFGKNFFARFMLLHQNSQTDDPQAVKTVIDQSMQDIAYSAPQPEVYGAKDAAVSTKSGVDADKSYGNAVAAVLVSNAPSGDAATLAGQALDQNDPNALGSVSAVVTSYTSMLNDLSKIPVPSSLISYHVDLLNGVSSMLFVSKSMGKVFSDPLQSLVALNMYSSAQDALRTALSRLNDRFGQEGIAYSGNEPGLLFSTIK